MTAIRGRAGKFDIIDGAGACVAADLTFLGVVRAIERASDEDLTREEITERIEADGKVDLMVGGLPETYTIEGD